MEINHLYSNHEDPPVHHHLTPKFPLPLLRLDHLKMSYEVLICKAENKYNV